MPPTFAAITDNVGLQWGAFALCLALLILLGQFVAMMFRAQTRRIDRLEKALDERDAVIAAKDAQIAELARDVRDLHVRSMELWHKAMDVFRNRPCLADSTLGRDGGG